MTAELSGLLGNALLGVIKLCNKQNISTKSVIDNKLIRQFMRHYNNLFQLEISKQSGNSEMKYTSALTPLADQMSLMLRQKNAVIASEESIEDKKRQKTEEPEIIVNQDLNKEVD